MFDLNSTEGQNLRKSLQNERELLLLMTKLTDEQLHHLLKTSSDYAEAIKAHQRTIEAQTNLKSKEIDQQNYHKRLEEETKREQEATKRKEIEWKAKKDLEQEITEQEKKRVQYKLAEETEEIKKRIQLELQAKQEFLRIEQDRLRADEEAQRKKVEVEEIKKLSELEHARKKMEMKAKIERETEVKMADFRLSQSLKVHEATKEDNLKKEIELQKVRSAFDVEKEKQKWMLMTEFFSGDEGRRRMWNIGGLLGGSIGILFTFKTGYPLIQKALKKYFFKPTLVSRSVRYSRLSWLNPLKSNKGEVNVILEPKLQAKMEGILQATRNTASRGGLFGHLMMYGPPGTGKTLFAEKIAQESQMDFAVMSGPSFDQFSPKEAIIQIKNLFQWANKSRTGLLLFVDEADSFLEDRSTLDPNRVRVLNEWINQTGTETRKFMCVYETNRPEVLDSAIHSRVTRSIEIGTPSKNEILKILQLYIHHYIFQDGTSESSLSHTSSRTSLFSRLFQIFRWNKPQRIKAEILTSETKLESMADRLANEGFVGRDVTNLVIALAQTAYAHPTFELDENLVDLVMEEQIMKKIRQKEFSKHRHKAIPLSIKS